jgi:hypothetical protein
MSLCRVLEPDRPRKQRGLRRGNNRGLLFHPDRQATAPRRPRRAGEAAWRIACTGSTMLAIEQTPAIEVARAGDQSHFNYAVIAFPFRRAEEISRVTLKTQFGVKWPDT